MGSQNPKVMEIEFFGTLSVKCGFYQCPVKQNNTISILEMLFQYLAHTNDPQMINKMIQHVAYDFPMILQKENHKLPSMDGIVASLYCTCALCLHPYQ